MWTSKDLGLGRCVATNGKGQVVGVDDGNGTFVVGADGARAELGGGDGSSMSIGLGIDDAGNVVGYAEGANGRTAVRYTDGRWGAIQGVSGFGLALAVGSDGAIVGVTLSSDGSTLQGFLSANGAIGSLPLPPDRSSIAQAAATAGLIAGVLEDSSGNSRAFRVANGALTELGTLGGNGSTALAINAKGDVVGQAEAATGEGHAFVVVAGTTTLVDLGLPAGALRSDARGVDARGRVAGNAEFADGSSHPFVFQSAQAPIDILPSDATGTPYKSAHAAAIAPDGRIVGWGVPRGGDAGSITHCLLWTPGE